MSNQVATAEQANVVPMGQGASILEVISRAASDPNIDVSKMETLLGLQERVMAQDAVRDFAVAMRDAQAEMPAVVKDADNRQTRSRYATYKAICEAMGPVITRHGFSLSFGTAQAPVAGHHRVTCRVYHVGGHTEDYFADVPVDLAGLKGGANKTPVHGFGSSLTYARRYLKTLIFDVAFTDADDDDGNGAFVDGRPYISPQQAEILKRLIDQTGADLKRFCQHFKVQSVDELYVSQFAKAKQALEAKRQRR